MKENEKIEILNTLNAQSQDLAGLVEYQTASIVSKKILHKSVGSITLFAFDAGESLSEHTAPYHAFVLCVDGEAEIIIAGKKMLLQKGQSVIMPANQPHAVNAVKQFKMLLVMIRS